MAHNFELEIELKSSADKLWHGIKEFATLFPKAVPDLYESVHVLEGDGRSAGSIFVSKYKPEIESGGMAAKERIEFVDEGRRRLSYSFVEGEILKSYKSFKAVVSVRDKGDENGGAVLKYAAEIEKANGQVPDPDITIKFKGFAAKVYQDLDAYLLKNP